MENTPETIKPAPPIEITEDIQVSLNRLGRDLETHAESGIRIGKELIYLKEITPHGRFGDLVEWAYGLKRTTRENYMNVAEKYGQNPNQLGFSTTVLIELSRPSVPESARKEAQDHESLTVKQAKDLVKAHKDLADLQAKLDQKITPSLDNLIPELKTLLDKENITNRVALIYSQLSKDEQGTALTTEKSKLFLLDEIRRMEREKYSLSQTATKAHEKADAMQVSFDDAVGKSTQEILSAKDKEIEIAKKELAQAKIEAREQLEESIRSAVDREYQDEIIKATKEKEKAEKAKKDAQDKASAAYVAQGDLEHEVKKLKEQLEVNNPTNVDLAMEKQIQSVANSVSFVLKRLRQDMLTIGGGMERSIMAVEEIKKEISQKLTELLGDSEQIITISGE